MKNVRSRSCWLLALALLVGTAGSAWAQVAPFGRPNIAPTATVVSSTQPVPGDYQAAYVIDGTLATMLYSMTPDSTTSGRYYCEVILDLGTVRQLDAVDVFMAQTYGFSLAVSDDNQAWTEVATRSWPATVDGPLHIALAPAVSGRYLRYHAWADWPQYVGLSEMAIYEAGSQPTVPPAGSLAATPLTGMSVFHEYTAALAANPAANLVDGDPSTTWVGGAPLHDDATGRFSYYGLVVLDLGAETSIGRIVVKSKGLHSITLSALQSMDATAFTWGPQWLFAVAPDDFFSSTTVTGDLVFDLEGRFAGRYLALWVKTMQPPEATRPEIAEIQVYPWMECAAPPTDSDGDTVADDRDQCPDTPQGQTVYANGCPAVPGDYNGNNELDLEDVLGILQVLTQKI